MPAAAALILVAAAAGPPVAHLTPSAAVRGTELAGGVAEFLGIRYAAPPTGRLRFRPSAPPHAWIGTVPATEYGPSCLQLPLDGAASEDCLFLNVWAPAGRTGLPVYFWIHGGGFVSGSGRDYNGSALAAQGLVVVTANYRLAAAGFYASAAASAEGGTTGGMNGITDQLRALRWVRANVASFGGDPQAITVAGESSGGISVSYIMHIPEASALYRRAVVESGSCVVARDVGVPYSAAAGEATSAAWAASLGCHSVECLRALPADNLTSTGLWFAVRPSVDGAAVPSDPFDLPVVLPAQGRAEVLIGSTSLDTVCAPPWDGGGGKGRLPPWPSTCAELSANLTGVFGAAVSEEVVQEYGCSASRPELTWLAVSRDVSITCPALWLSEKVAGSRPDASVRLYQFSYNPSASGWAGLAAHGAELSYVFDDPSAGYRPARSWNRSLAAAVSGYWASFTATGTPGGAVAWPVAGHGRQYLDFDEVTGVKAGYGGSCGFWRRYLAATNYTGAHAEAYKAMVNQCFS
eukprot:TRINITY_DN26827_c0_g1_i1.p1 TRINITY_DN26827_c0_g1~~TRINITY_DN26827_c0_g1_i1.p1  ORF type:complete len:542 (+),score=158.41 TRINITY_DN26827_c0_g1_i1:64-1626(+)